MIFGGCRRVGAAFALGRVLALGLTFGVMLGACSDGQSAPPTTSSPVGTSSSATQSPAAYQPSGSPTSTPTASGTVTRPVLPAAATKPTRDGAVAFFAYFISVYSYGYQTLDTEMLRAICDKGSVFCNSAIQTIEDNKRRGLTRRGGTVTVGVAVAAPGKASEGIVVQAVVRQEAITTLNSDGSVFSTSPAQLRTRSDARVQFRDGRWRMIALHVLKAGESS